MSFVVVVWVGGSSEQLYFVVGRSRGKMVITDSINSATRFSTRARAVAVHDELVESGEVPQIAIWETTLFPPNNELECGVLEVDGKLTLTDIVLSYAWIITKGR